MACVICKRKQSVGMGLDVSRCFSRPLGEACFSYSECFLDRNATQSATLMRWFVVFLSPMLWQIHVAQLVVYHAPNRKRGGNVARQMVWEYSLASCSDRARVSVGFADNAVRLPYRKLFLCFFFECSPSRRHSVLGLSFVLRNKNIDWKALDGAVFHSLCQVHAVSMSTKRWHIDTSLGLA